MAFQDNSPWKQIGTLSTLGIMMVVCTVIGLGAGYYLDRWLGTRPWFTLILTVLGIVAGYVNLFKEVRRFSGKD